ncbi:MAG: hypothetical protein KC731_30965 [Myxococcales bacterium]|nr:hypothetical protein [Myxococcales bacterium]
MSPNPISQNQYRELRVTSSLSDDPDYAGGDPQQVPDEADVVTLRAPGVVDPRVAVSLKVQVVVEWLDAEAAVVTASRGSFDLQAIHVSHRQGPLTGQFVTDSMPLRSQVAYRPVVIDELMAGDRFTVRLSGMSAPASAVKARVLYREIL